MTEPYDPNPAPPISGYPPPPSYDQPGYDQPGYAQPGSGQPGFAHPGYIQSGFAQPGSGQPAYGQPVYGPPPQVYPQPYLPQGYPPAPMAYPGYPGSSSPDDRPGVTVASAVLGFVAGGLLIAAGLLLLMGASFVNALSSDISSDDHNAAVWLGLAGAANIAAAACAIVGGIIVLTRKPAGRILISVAAALSAICAIGWLTQDGGGAIFFILVLTVPLLVAAPLSWHRSVTNWLNAARR